MKRVREWLEETHSDTFELVRHFLARFFDSEMVAGTGEWQKVAIGAFAALVSLGIVGINVYWHRYALLQSPGIGTPALYRAAVREDLLAFIGLAMGITALLTLVQWDALFPSLRDCLALAGFPVSARQIFVAKFSALVLLFTACALALNAPLSGLFSTAISGDLARESLSFRPQVCDACQHHWRLHLRFLHPARIPGSSAQHRTRTLLPASVPSPSGRAVHRRG